MMSLFPLWSKMTLEVPAFRPLFVLRRIALALIHVALWTSAFVIALELRFVGAVPSETRASAIWSLAFLIALRLLFFLRAGLFDGIYRYSGMPSLKKIVWNSTAASAVVVATEQLLRVHNPSPRSLFVGEWLASIVLVGGMRMAIRAIYERGARSKDTVATVVIGAGDAAESLLRDLRRMRDGASWRVIGLLDDDPTKNGLILHSARVLGSADEATLRRVVQEHKVQVAVLAIPSAPSDRVRDLVKQCRALGLQVKTVPGLTDRLAGNAGLPVMREIDIEDLLRREPAVLDLTQVGEFLSGKVVLVTGAGGSIGSELARQSLGFDPRQLILLEQDENALFFIERELREKFPKAEVVAVLGDITNAIRVNELFAERRPQIVLHAAAHKHVGMLENNSCQAVRNNVFGTFTVAQAAHDAGVEAFVMISTDKAVNPTSVMGATKRVTEMIMQQMAQVSRTRFTAVRFGNVLGSAGSVVPLFRAQIAAGGPVTVTHPDVRRYFMTIPEAVQLVLQAGALGGTGEIFLLDMGEPVKVLDLARDLITLSGLRPDIDIEIKFTGLKSGEKLFEEMLLGDEGYDATTNAKIVVGRIQPMPRKVLEEGLDRLLAASTDGDDLGVRRELTRLVPEATLVMPPEPAQDTPPNVARIVRRNGIVRIRGPEDTFQPTPLRVMRVAGARPTE